MDFIDYLDQPNVYKGLRSPGCVHDVHPRPEAQGLGTEALLHGTSSRIFTLVQLHLGGD